MPFLLANPSFCCNSFTLWSLKNIIFWKALLADFLYVVRFYRERRSVLGEFPHGDALSSLFCLRQSSKMTTNQSLCGRTLCCACAWGSSLAHQMMDVGQKYHSQICEGPEGCSAVSTLTGVCDWPEASVFPVGCWCRSRFLLVRAFESLNMAGTANHGSTWWTCKHDQCQGMGM